MSDFLLFGYFQQANKEKRLYGLLIRSRGFMVSLGDLLGALRTDLIIVVFIQQLSILPQFIQIVRPYLHHLASCFQIL